MDSILYSIWFLLAVSALVLFGYVSLNVLIELEDANRLDGKWHEPWVLALTLPWVPVIGVFAATEAAYARTGYLFGGADLPPDYNDTSKRLGEVYP